MKKITDEKTNMKWIIKLKVVDKKAQNAHKKSVLIDIGETVSTELIGATCTWMYKELCDLDRAIELSKQLKNHLKKV